ncbi:hypothetical protein FJ970_02795 [Mesorhizobium sp. B2-1-8]|uniref:hypothetical protein n=1 Tax=Mesorhizobium sp. B2-1-8 TaxID=2589967 RepID=UPI00112AC0CD|nr:hypothetical protein [Mesorhizobium sp. B2-1-8]UCI19917.1 hypothetical protein FJ970_02795 [Mesorhizobium sp. B2-1-8]
MNKGLRIVGLLIAILAVTFYSSQMPVSAQIVETGVAAGTVGAFLDGLRATVKQLEDSAHSLIDHGNIALAQQQMLLAGIISKTIDQVSSAYADSLGKTMSQLSIAEQNTFTGLAEQIDALNHLEDKTSGDIQQVIYKTQGAANQLLDVLPFTERYPIFYGVSIRDLTTDPAQHPSDVEIFGFHLSDPKLDRKAPQISVSGEQIPDDLISVQEDRIQVQIPDALKEKIGFGNKACDPRKTFQIAIMVFYSIQRGYWPISWSSEKEMKFNANALPGADLYDLKVTYSGTRTTNPLVSHTFSARSGYAAMGCEQTTSAAATYQLPQGAQEIQCSAAWVDTSNIGSSSQNCAVGGLVATGSGSMRGRNKDCIKIPPFGPNVCNCPGGGHGTLQISGTYKVPEPTNEDLTGVEVGAYVLKGGSDVSASLPEDATVIIKKVEVSVARRACEAQLDSISINVPNANQRLSQTSKLGLFQATLWNGQLNVRKP